MIGQALGTANRPQKLSLKGGRIEAPRGGIDDRIALSEGDLTHAIYTYNLLPHEQGMKVRDGYREWQIDVDSGTSQGVNCIIPFDGIVQTGLSDKLFVANTEGIYDVTEAGDTPVLKATFNNSTASAGYGVYIHYTEQDETDGMFYSDSQNGLFYYDEVADTWALATGITGPTIAAIRFVALHKDRIWVVEQDKNYAWYLPLNAKEGAATKFHFGDKFPNGGNVAGLFSWSMDTSDGTNNFFVAVSRAGDVLVYSGSDPGNATGEDPWELVGTFFIGQVPAGPTFGSVNGGDLYILSIYGLNSMAEILQGVNSAQLFNSPETTAPSAKIAKFIQARLALTINDFGWQVRLAPSENALLICGPSIPGKADIQYLYRLTTAAWGLWRNVPMRCFETWKNNVVFGDADSRVLYMDVPVDNLLLTPPAAPAVNGQNITFSVLTSFRDLAAPSLYKRAKIIRPDFMSFAEPSYSLTARYDYDIREAFLSAPPPAPTEGDLWDVGEWDEAIWGVSELQNYSGFQGAWGEGRTVAIAMIGACREPTLFIGWDLLYDVGGPLI